MEIPKKQMKNQSIKISEMIEKHSEKPTYKLRDLVRTAVIKKVFSTGDPTNCSYKLYILTEVIDDTIPSYKLNYKPER